MKVHIMKFCPTTTVTVPDYKELMYQWRNWRTDTEWFYIGRVIVEKPLTDAQFNRLHRDLQAKVRNPDDSVTFLESLWALEDTRGAA